MPDDVALHHGEGAPDEPHGSVGVSAGPAPHDLPRPSFELRRLTATIVGEQREPTRHRLEPVHAWAALAGRLGGQVRGYPRGFAQRTRRRGERDDNAGAQSLVCEKTMPRVACPVAEVPPDEEGIDGFGCAARELDGVGELRPELDLVDPRPCHRAEIVSSAVPGSALVPSERNHDAPNRATRARWASVSTFWTSVGAPRRPLSNG